MMLAGFRIIESRHALEASAERLFPTSRHRSARVRKKLIRRHGGEFRMVPCMFIDKVNGVVFAHPERVADLRAALPKMQGRVPQ
jgi:hypothetical protein